LDASEIAVRIKAMIKVEKIPLLILTNREREAYSHGLQGLPPRSYDKFFLTGLDWLFLDLELEWTFTLFVCKELELDLTFLFMRISFSQKNTTFKGKFTSLLLTFGSEWSWIDTSPLIGCLRDSCQD
jgi:hypothetical protein